MRFAAEWAALMLLGGALGIGTAEAVRAGWVSDRTVFAFYAVLTVAAAAFAMWHARDAHVLWDDWDDDPDDSTPPAL